MESVKRGTWIPVSCRIAVASYCTARSTSGNCILCRIAACELILEYTLAAAAVAKGFTAYLASLAYQHVKKIRLQVVRGMKAKVETMYALHHVVCTHCYA